MLTIATYQQNPAGEDFIITGKVEAATVEQARAFAAQYAPEEVDQFWPQETTDHIKQMLAAPQAQERCLVVDAWGTPNAADFLIGHTEAYNQSYQHLERIPVTLEAENF